MKGEESKKPFVSGERVFEVKNGQRHNDGEVDMPSRSPHGNRKECDSRLRNAHSLLIARENGRAQRCKRASVLLTFSELFL